VVAVDGDTAVIGAPYRDETGRDSGAAYIFEWNGYNWIQTAKLLPDDENKPIFNFGDAVAISGDTVVIGNPDAFSYREDRMGVAYVFVRDGNTWTQQAKLVADDTSSQIYFGTTVDIDGDTVVVGNPYGYQPGNIGDGAAYVFKRSGSTWSQEAKLPAPAEVEYKSDFGFSVAVSGDTAAVSSNRSDIVVFVRSGNQWTQQQNIQAADPETSGEGLALDGDTLVVGYANAQNYSNLGAVFTRTNGVWEFEASLPASYISRPTFRNDFVAVDIDNDKIVVNANSDIAQGYVFVRDNGEWVSRLHLFEARSADDVAISGNHVLAGVDFWSDYHPNSGAVFAYQLPDDFQPYVTSITPDDDDDLVPIDADVTVTFSELVDIGFSAVIVDCPSYPQLWQSQVTAQDVTEITVNPPDFAPRETCTLDVQLPTRQGKTLMAHEWATTAT
jgi:hypothetical protein